MGAPACNGEASAARVSRIRRMSARPAANAREPLHPGTDKAGSPMRRDKPRHDATLARGTRTGSANGCCVTADRDAGLVLAAPHDAPHLPTDSCNRSSWKAKNFQLYIIM